MAGKNDNENANLTNDEEIKTPELVEIEIEGRKVKVEKDGEVHKMYMTFKQTVNETEYAEQREDLRSALDTAIEDVLGAFSEDVYADMHYVSTLGNDALIFKGKDPRDIKTDEDRANHTFTSRLGQAGTVQVQRRVRAPKA